MKILFFAQARQATLCSELDLPVEAPLSAPELWSLLETRFPSLKPLRRSTRLARNCIYASPDEIFHDPDEVALIPPVSGG